MNDDEAPEDQRQYSRYLSEMDAVLSEKGAVLDEAAHAVDVSAAGFRAVTRAKLAEGQVIDFELVLGDGDRVRGRGRVAWAQQDALQFDFWSVGVKIIKMGWSDTSRLRRAVYTPGYDFVGLARVTFYAAFFVIVAAAAQNILFHQPVVRSILWKLAPVMAALAVLVASLFMLLG